MTEPNLAYQLWSLLIIILVGAAAYYFFYYKKREQKKAPDQSYLLGLRFMAEGDRRRAIEQFKQTVREDSTNIDAYIKLGDILREEGLFNNAIRIHNDLTMRADLTDTHKPVVYLSLARDYWQAGKFDQARVYFSKLAKNNLLKEKAIPFLVQYYEDSRQYEAAYDILKNSARRNEPAVQKKLALYKVFAGLKLVEEKQEKNARILFKEALKHDGECAAAHACLGDSYIREDRPDEAINVWTEYCERCPSQAYLLFSRLERAWFEKGIYLKNEELYSRILEKDPDNIHALLALSTMYRKKGEYAAAIKLIEDNMRAEFDLALLKAEQVRNYSADGQLNKASVLALELLDDTWAFKNMRFECPSCKHKSDEPFWKCPKCNTINTGS